ncbi:nucleoside 2-deoxyribosyltransferase [Desulfoplanes sp.]
MEAPKKIQSNRRNFLIKSGVIAVGLALGDQLVFAKPNTDVSLMKIYCAGPLFNDLEREMMSNIADALEAYGFKTYLPHRDGFEFSELSPSLTKTGVPPQKAQQLLNKIIFNFDIYNLLQCDATVFNMNGRVPDGGSIVEASVTWACGHPLVIYKDDPRTLEFGIDNPMITGLADFTKVQTIADIPKTIHTEIKNTIKPMDIHSYPEKLKKTFQTGQKIAKIKEKYTDNMKICNELLKILQ